MANAKTRKLYIYDPHVGTDLQYLQSLNVPIPPKPRAGAEGKQAAMAAWREQIRELAYRVCEREIAREEIAEARWEQFVRTHDLCELDGRQGKPKLTAERWPTIHRMEN